MDKRPLSEVIASAQSGSAEGFEVLLERYGPRLYGFFVRATGNAHEAEDLLSEVTVRLVERLGRYDHRGRFEQWLFRIAANLVRDRFRRAKARPAVGSMDRPDQAGVSLAEKLPGPEHDVAARMELAEQVEQMHEAMGKLDEPTRLAMLLRHFGQLSFKQIAEIMACPLGTALARVHRGLESLRRMMVDEDET